MEQNVFLALLAMDAYNRGPAGSRSRIDGLSSTLGTSIGQATLRYVSLGSDYSNSGYTALGYEWNGKIVISYRGTDNISFLPTSDVQGGWLTGAGYGSAQATAALDTYDTVVSNLLSPQVTDIILTGQSLGGGLAGYVSALTGADAVLFEHMPYMNAAEADSSITFTNQIAFHVEGEVLQGLRSLGSDSDEAVSTELSIYGAEIPSHQEYYFTFPSLFYLHQPEMNVIMMFGNQSSIGTDWHDSAKYWIPALFDWSTIDAINVNPIEEAPYHNLKMLGAIAYSSLDTQEDGNTIFGNTGIRSLFNDANDLGEAISTTYSSTFSEINKYSIGKMIAQFSGTMALNKVENNNYAKEGIINFDEYTLGFVTSDKLWSSYGSYTPATSVRLGYDNLFGGALAEIGFSQDLIFAEDDMRAWYVDSNASSVLYDSLSNIARFEDTRSAVAFGAIVKFYDSAPGIEIGDNWDGRLNSNDAILAIGNSIDNEIRGSSRDDVIYGGDGDDILEGRGGQNVLIGGNGNDTVDYSDSLEEVNINVNGNSIAIENALGTDYVIGIENIKGTTFADKIAITGTIDLEHDITIDANGGQTGLADIIDAKDSSDLSGVTVTINQTSGEGFIRSRSGTGGKINLLNFTTDIIGSEYSDLISDESGHDHLVDGKGGDDNITVGGLDATVDGGAGNDVIHLKSQSATIKFGVGDGSDVVEFDAGDGDYTLALQNLNQDDIAIIAGGHSIYGTGNDDLFLQFITIRVGGTGDQITFLENGKNIGPGGSTYDTSGNSRKLGSITFADGTVLTQAALSDQLAQAALGINSLPITLDTWGYKKDFPFSANYLSARHYADEYLDYVNATYLQAAPVGTPPPPPDQSLTGTSGDENFNPGNGNDIVDGGGGNDTIQESQGNDTYVWNVGGGDDTIVGFDASDGFNTLQLGAGISPTDLQFAVAIDGAGLTLSFANQPGSISLSDQLVGGGYGIDRIQFADGTAMMRTDLLAAASSVITAAQVTVNGTASADFLRPTRGNFIVNGAGGDDIITVNGSGAGTFRFSSADGHDEINDWGFGYNRNDTLELTNVNADGVSLSRSGDALLVTVNSTGASVNVTKQFEQDDGNTHGISTIKFADGTIWTRAQIRDLISAAMGNTSPVAQVATATAIEDAALVRGTLSASDPDAGDTLTFKLDDKVEGLVLAANGQWSFDPTAPAYNYLESGQTLAVVANYHVTDKAGATSSSTLTIAVTGTEDMPSVQGPQPIYGTSGDDMLVGSSGNDSLYGEDGDDSLDGGAGADLMVGGSGNDFYHVDNAGDVIVENAYEGWDSAAPTIDFTLPDNVEGLYMGSGAALEGTGNDLDNEIYGNDYANILSGLGGADYIVGGLGNDRLIGGVGNDLLAGEDGSADVAVYAGLQSSFTIATVDGTVTITDNDPAIDGDEGTDSLYGIEVVEFQGGVQAGISSPIVLDLNGNGVTLVDNSRTKIAFDWDGDGIKNQTGWIGRDDGFLFIDRDGNGTVTDGGELSFTSDKDGAKSDLDGLRAFDSNEDGLFSSADDQFAQFKIWRDKNGNGRVDKKEILSLQKAGIASIELNGKAVNQSWEWGENITVNTGSFTRTNGRVGSFSDIALSYDTNSPQNASISKAASQLSEAIAGFFGNRGTSDFASRENWMENRTDFMASPRWFGR